MATFPYVASGLPNPIILTAGSYYATPAVTIKDGDDNTIALDGSTTVKFTVSRYYEATASEDLVLQLSVGAGITVTDGTDTIDIVMTAAQTAAFVERYGETAQFYADLQVNVDGAADIHNMRTVIVAKRNITE